MTTLPLSAALRDLAATDATDPAMDDVGSLIAAQDALLAERLLLSAEVTALRARIARALDALRTAPDLDTIERGKAAWRQTHTAILGAWAELAEEPPSRR